VTDREVRELLDEYGRGLRAEFRREMLELRAEVADLVAEEMYQRVQADKTVQRDIDELASMTHHIHRDPV
jgi:hypothetical protein